MVIFNCAFSVSKKFSAICIAAVITVAVVCVISMVALNSESVNSTAQCQEIGEYSLLAANTQEQLDFLQQFGITTDKNPIQTKLCIIPSEFNKTYTEYNELQKKIGLDLLPYNGKKANIVTYRITNKEDFVTLLIYKKRVIAAHISSTKYKDKYKPLI